MRRGVLVFVLIGLAAGPIGWVGWVVSDRLESRNEFCVACHLDGGRRLHDRKMREFEADPAVNLASLHAGAAVRCIDCHGGASFPNKLRVKTVAARDALFYFAGAFGEPTSMAHPLWDEDCIQCHAEYAAVRDDDFHAFEAHNVSDFAYACVACHQSHTRRGHSTATGSDPARFPFFLNGRVVMPVCSNCHEES